MTIRYIILYYSITCYTISYYIILTHLSLSDGRAVHREGVTGVVHLHVAHEPGGGDLNVRFYVSVFFILCFARFLVHVLVHTHTDTQKAKEELTLEACRTHKHSFSRTLNKPLTVAECCRTPR